MATASTIFERVFAQVESAWGVAPNSSGTATVAGADYVRHTRCEMVPAGTRIASSDKTGTKSATRGAIGSRSGRWTLQQEIRPSGTAGTAPDVDPLLQAAFGQAPTVVASTSVTYNLHATAIKSATIYRFRSPSTVAQQAILGAVVQELSVQFEQQANAQWTFTGTGLAVPSSKTFSVLPTVAKGGLSAFPSEPASPVSNGAPVSSLAGSVTIGGHTGLQVTSCAIRIQTSIDTPSDRLFAGAYASGPESDTLAAFIDLTIIDEDTAAIDDILSKIENNETMDVEFVCGSTAGQRVKFQLNDCEFPDPQLDDSSRKWALNLRGIRAYATNSTAADEVKIVFD